MDRAAKIGAGGSSSGDGRPWGVGLAGQPMKEVSSWGNATDRARATRGQLDTEGLYSLTVSGILRETRAEPWGHAGKR
jgi:hypothetical protein